MTVHNSVTIDIWKQNQLKVINKSNSKRMNCENLKQKETPVKDAVHKSQPVSQVRIKTC